MMNNTASASVIDHIARSSSWSRMILAVAVVPEGLPSLAATQEAARRAVRATVNKILNYMGSG